MFFIFICFVRCYINWEDIHRQAATPNDVTRGIKAYDRRNMEDNVNFYNFKKNEWMDQKPSLYDKTVAMTQLINAALSGDTEARYDYFKKLDATMDDIRLAIDQNEKVTSPDNYSGRPINLIDWITNDYLEEEEHDAELSQEVEDQFAADQQEAHYEITNKENRFLDERRHTRNKQNEYIQQLRQTFNVE